MRNAASADVTDFLGRFSLFTIRCQKMLTGNSTDRISNRDFMLWQGQLENLAPHIPFKNVRAALSSHCVRVKFISFSFLKVLCQDLAP